MNGADPDDRPVLFVYWGRRGALSSFTLALCGVLAQCPGVRAKVSVSRDNELWNDFVRFGDLIVPFDTFRSGPGALFELPGGWRRMRRLVGQLKAERYRAVVVLMPHLWTPFLGAMLRGTPIRYVPIIHDAEPHPGDRTAIVTPWLLRDARHGDAVITLSESVRAKLIAQGRASAEAVTALFHPTFGGASLHGGRPHCPFRFLFLGRIARYKGLSLLLDAAELLRHEGVAFSLAVVGEGQLGSDAERLAALSAKVVNRWVAHDEIGPVLAETDAVVLPYLEASQSGVAALAGGHGVPVIATAVGGLGEQVQHERTGLVVAPVTAEALAAAMHRLATDRDLYGRLAESVAEESERRSMRSFLAEVLGIVNRTRKRP